MSILQETPTNGQSVFPIAGPWCRVSLFLPLNKAFVALYIVLIMLAYLQEFDELTF